MRLGTWMGQLARNRFSIAPEKLPAALSITGFSLFNTAAVAVERMVYGKRIDAVQLPAEPIFILGHWRAGTTLLHEYLIRDPAHTYPTTYQCFAPHHFVLTEKWITPWTKKLLPSRRPMDNMAAGWQRPQEDEFALGNLGVPTPYHSMIFPKRGPVNEQYLDLQELSDTDREVWKRELMRFFQRLTFRDPRRIVVKSPPHTARMRTLLEMFPNAKFVHIVRDPYKLFLSTINLWKSLNEVQRMQGVGDQQWVEDYVLRSFDRMYAAFERDRQLLGDDQLYELRYEDLTDDPTTCIQTIYDKLNLGDYSRIEGPLQQYLAEVKNYRRNKFDLPDDKRDLVHHHWSGYFDQYGYE